MKFERFIYEVKASVELTAEEVEVLCELAANHYDDTCRSAEIPGPGAFLNGARNGIIANEGTVSLTTVENVGVPPMRSVVQDFGDGTVSLSP